MKVDLELVSDLFRGAAAIAAYTPIPELQKILCYAAVLAQLGDEAHDRRVALRERLNVWVAESRGPSTDELDAMQASRDELDAKLAAIEQRLKGGGDSP